MLLSEQRGRGLEQLEVVRQVIMRAAPLSEQERDAFGTYNAALKRQIDSLDEALGRTGQDKTSLETLRYLLEAIPGIFF